MVKENGKKGKRKENGNRQKGKRKENIVKENGKKKRKKKEQWDNGV